MSFTSSERRGLIALAAVMTVLIAVTAWLTGRNHAPASLPSTADDTTAVAVAVAVIDTAAADTVTMPTRKRRGIRRKNTTRKRAATPSARRILNDTVKR
ncbi:MAG: hypothetical protein K2L30_00045 [Duncaniella sp.]|nr:hypothetical protein [Duncaniella sp.]